jgi:hypothetical protein
MRIGQGLEERAEKQPECLPETSARSARFPKAGYVGVEFVHRKAWCLRWYFWNGAIDGRKAASCDQAGDGHVFLEHEAMGTRE